MSVQLDDAKLVAPCGLYCGVCPVFMASSNSALAEKLAQTMGLPTEQIKCLGCKTEKGHIKIMGEPVCPTYHCTNMGMFVQPCVLVG